MFRGGQAGQNTKFLTVLKLGGGGAGGRLGTLNDIHFEFSHMKPS